MDSILVDLRDSIAGRFADASAESYLSGAEVKAEGKGEGAVRRDCGECRGQNR